MYEIVSIEEVESTQENVGASSFLQSVFWAGFKEKSGWKKKLFLVSCKRNASDNCTTFYLSVLSRHIKFFGLLAYVPMLEDIMNRDEVEDVSGERGTFLQELCARLFDLLPRNVFLIRVDPAWQVEVENAGGSGCHADKVERPHINFGREKSEKDESRQADSIKASDCVHQSNGEHKSDDVSLSVCNRRCKSLYLKKAKTDIQPPDTVILPLEKNEDEIMAQFKSKWRYNIRLAEKKGCVVECMPMSTGTEIDAGLDVFYSLYETTAQRDGIAIHTKSYYKTLFLLADKFPDLSVRLYVAKYEGLFLAAIITIFYKYEATYLYGASSNEYRNLMPTYLLQYRAIMDAKAFGCKTYDFYGMPPREDEGHPMAGLYRFKTGFGGKIVHRIGSIDAYCNKWRYGVYSLAEEARAFYFKRIKKWLKR